MHERREGHDLLGRHRPLVFRLRMSSSICAADYIKGAAMKCASMSDLPLRSAVIEAG